jgi:hypothetical protein
MKKKNVAKADGTMTPTFPLLHKSNTSGKAGGL